MSVIAETEGRGLFGQAAQAYDQVRPPYPEAYFSLLVNQGVLFPGCATLEIGAGSGLATHRLLALGANPLTVIEPDRGFGELLSKIEQASSGALHLLPCTFEEAELANRAFDLVVIATAFHWLDPQVRVAKIARLLKQHGSVVLLWNIFGDLAKHDDFHEATKHLLVHLVPSPSGAPEKLPFALDRAAREAEFIGGGDFALSTFLETHWTLTLNPNQVRSLYSGFSSIARLPDEERLPLLERLAAIADVQFGGKVIRNMTSPMYIFRRL